MTAPYIFKANEPDMMGRQWIVVAETGEYEWFDSREKAMAWMETHTADGPAPLPASDVLSTLTVYAGNESSCCARWHDDTHRYHLWLEGCDRGAVIHCNSIAKGPHDRGKHTTRDPKAAVNAPLVNRIWDIVRANFLIDKAHAERKVREAEEERQRRGKQIEDLRAQAFSLGFNLVPFEKDAP